MSRLFTRNLKCRPQIYRKAASGPLPASLFSSLAPDAPAPAYSDLASLHCPKTQARYWLCSHSPRAGGTAPLPPPHSMHLQPHVELNSQDQWWEKTDSSLVYRWFHR